MHCLVFTDTDLFSLTKGKSYLAKQKWRRSTCLRDQCYDVGCHPCVSGPCLPQGGEDWPVVYICIIFRSYSLFLPNTYDFSNKPYSHVYFLCHLRSMVDT